MNEQILKVTAEVLVAEFLQRPCELPATVAHRRPVDADQSSVINRVFVKPQLGD
jgi:hypothetical protein